MNPEDNAKLERLVQAAVQGLPARRAPRTLESRVLAEIERRARLPWWKKSFVHWPMAARAAFLVGSLVLVKLVLNTLGWVLAGFSGGSVRSTFASQFAWLDSVASVFTAMGGFFEIMLRSIPPVWFYGSLVFFAAMYAALFGLGAAAYRTLYAQR